MREDEHAGRAAAGDAVRPTLHVAAALVIRDGCVLVQTRPAGRSWAGWWEFPGGKLEAGEDVAACAVREVLEEAGLAVSAGETLHEVTWGRPEALVHVRFVVCTCAAGSEAQPKEGQLLRWVGADELDALSFLPANANLLPLLAARLRVTSP